MTEQPITNLERDRTCQVLHSTLSRPQNTKQLPAGGLRLQERHISRENMWSHSVHFGENREIGAFRPSFKVGGFNTQIATHHLHRYPTIVRSMPSSGSPRTLVTTQAQLPAIPSSTVPPTVPSFERQSSCACHNLLGWARHITWKLRRRHVLSAGAFASNLCTRSRSSDRRYSSRTSSATTMSAAVLPASST